MIYILSIIQILLRMRSKMEKLLIQLNIKNYMINLKINLILMIVFKFLVILELDLE